MNVLDKNKSGGLSKLNQAVKVASGGYFTDVDAAFKQMVADCKTAGSADKFLKNYCGIDLSNKDTGAITGKDAGGSTEKTANSIVPESGNLKTFTDKTFKIKGLTVKLRKSYSSLSVKEKYMWQGLYTWWMESALKLIEESYGSNFGFDKNSSAMVTEISVNFYSQNDGRLAAVDQTIDVTGKTSGLTLNINTYYYDTIDISDTNGVTDIEGVGYLDRTIAHEMTHAVMAANISSHNELPKIIREGMAELTHGTDDERKSDIQKLAGNSKLLEQSLRISTAYNNQVAKVDAPDYAAGYMFLRYLAKQGAENGIYSEISTAGGDAQQVTLPSSYAKRGSTIKGGLFKADSNFASDIIDLSEYSSTVKKVDATKITSSLFIIGNESADSIKSGTGKDTISGNVNDDTIYGGKGNDVIFGDGGNDKLYGEAGNDTLYGGSGKNTLTGGAGKDIFVHDNGEDFIADYKAGEDKVVISDGEIGKISFSDSNVIFKTSNGNITVKNGNGQKITVIDQKGKETSKTYLAAGLSLSGKILTVSNKFTGNSIKVADYSGVTKVDASKVTKNLTITGNASANSIVGGTKNDTLYGGSGKNTLSGGDGKDVFVYSGGNDVITDYTAGQDKIKISSGKITKTTYSGKNVIFKIGNGTLTVQNGKGKKITITDSNNKTTTKKYKTAELFEDDNFVTDAVNLDSITEQKYSVQNIETQNNSNLEQEQNILTFTDK